MPLQPVALADTYRNITLKQNEQASPLTTLTANAVTDTLTLVAGPGISFGTGNAGDQIVIFNDFGDENATLSIRAIQIDGFNIDTNVIQLTDSNADLEIRANGSGQVYITDSLRVQDNLTVDGNTILGNTAADTITINGTAISTPNTITLTKDDATNNGIIYPVSFSHTTTATPANGIGTGIQFITETTANNNEIGLQIASVVTDTTAASEDFDFVIRQMIAGAAPAQTLKLNFNTIQVGANNTDLRLTTQGTSDLTIDTNSGTNSGYIKIFDGTNANIEIVPNGTGNLIIDGLNVNTTTISSIAANSDITLTPNGTGNVNLDGDTVRIGDSNSDAVLTTNGTGDLTLNTNSGTNSGYVKIFDGANANIEIVPNGTGTLIIGTQNWLAANTDTFFVSATNGSNTNDGRRMNTAFATVAYALSQAASGDTIQILPGTYTEVFPLTIPQGVTVRGSGIRSTMLKPTAGTNSNDCFLLNGETTVEELTIADMFYNSGANTGYAFRFNTAATVTVASRSPYIQRVTVINKGSTVTASDPYGFVSANAGRGVYIDGSRVTRASLEAAILFNECTFIVPNSRACIMTNGARTEWLNCFTYFADLAIEGVVGASGRGADGKTYISLTGTTGTWNVGNSLRYYANDGTTILAQGVIEAISGNTYTLDGSVSGFKTNANRDNKTVLVHGSAQLSTTSPKFGASSLRIASASSDYISLINDPDFGFGTGNFTVEFFWKPDAIGTQQVLLDMRTTATEVSLYIEMNSAGNLRLFVNGSYRITSSNTCTAAAWNHVAIYRSGTDTRVALNGTVSTTYTDSGDYGSSKPFKLGTSYTATSFTTTGYFDEVRIVKGVAKYGTSNFTQPASAFVGDSNTVLLLHLNGSNGSTVIVDDGVTIQDIRSSGGGTATGITRYDRKEFAAEMRSISSANVYGNQGVKADGADVVIQLMAHNFAYIGTGYDLTNNKATVNQANEVIEVNTGRVFYESVDQEGNFRIGDFFSVDFETGAVTFSGANFDVSSLTGINFTSGSNTTVIDPTQVATGNIIISGNTISTQAGGITIDPTGNNTITINGSTTLSGDFVLGGALTIDDASNSSVSSPLTVRHTTSGTPANGIGTGITFVTETANDTNRTGMILEAASTDVTSGSEDFSFNLKLMAAGAAASTKFSVSSVGDTVIEGDLQVKGGDLTTNQTTFNLLQTNATTVNFAAAATTMDIGSTGATAVINLNSTKDSTSVTTGGVVIDGGLGIAKNTYIGGSLARTGAISTSSWTTTGISIADIGSTFTDTSSTASTTIPIRVSNSLGQPTFASTNAVTLTNAATLYVANAPLAGTNTTITNPYAVYVASGNTLLAGDLAVNGGDLTTNQTTFNLLQTNATTVNFAGTSQTLNIASGAALDGQFIFGNILSGGALIPGVTTFDSPAGISISSPGTYNNVVDSSGGAIGGGTSGGTGGGATFNIVKTGNDTNYFGNVTITLVQRGFGYKVGDTITLLGSDLGGSTPLNDLVFVIGTAVTPGNTIKIASTSSGTVNLTTNVTTGDVNIFRSVTTGSLYIADGGASSTYIGGANSVLTVGTTSGNSTLLISSKSDGTGVAELSTNEYGTEARIFNEYVTVGKLFGEATTIDLARDASAACTLTFGNGVSDNQIKISSVPSGNISLTTDVITGVVNLFPSITTGTVNIANGGAATINIGGSGTLVSIGGNTLDSTLELVGNTISGNVTIRTTLGVETVNLFNTNNLVGNLFGNARTINIGNSGSSGVLTIKNDNVTLDGDLQVKGGDLTTNQTVFNLLPTSATTVNFADIATTLNLGKSATASSTLTFGPTITGNIFKISGIAGGTTSLTSDVTTGTVNLYTGVTTGTVNLATSGASTTNIGGGGSTINLGNTSGNTVLEVRGNATTGIATIRTNSGVATVNVFDTQATTANLFGAATNIEIGSTNGTTSINHSLTVDGNTTLGNASTDTVTINADSVAIPNTLTFTTNDANTNTVSFPIKLVHSTTGTPQLGIGTGIQLITETTDGVNRIGATIESITTDINSSTEDFDFVIRQMIAGNAAVQTLKLNSTTLQVGANNIASTITTQGNSNLTLSTNNGTNSGTIVINNGVNGNIVLTPNGTGDVYLDADTLRVGDSNSDTYITSNGESNLTLKTGNSIVLAITSYVGAGTTTVTGNLNAHGLVAGDIITISGATTTEQSKLNGTWTVATASANSFTFVISTALTAATYTTNIGTTTKVSAGYILINQGTNGNIVVEPHGTGDFQVNADTFRLGDNNLTAYLITNGTANLVLNPGTDIVLGNDASSATPSARILRGTDGAGTNVSAANLLLQGGLSTGNATGGSITFTTGTTLTTGTVLQTGTDRMSISPSSTNTTLDLVTAMTTANLFNSTATTVNFVGAATTLNIGNSTAAQTISIGNASTDTSTYNFATAPAASSKTKTVNLGTGGVTASTTNVNIGSSVAGTTTINSGTIVGALTTQNLFNTTATTINFGGAATIVEIGASTGTTNINHNLDVDGDVNIDGGDLIVSTTTFNLANTNATTLNLGGAATAVNVGVSAASASTLTFGPTITGNIFEINSTAAGTINLTSDVTTGTVNLYTGVTTGTVNLATGGASTTNIGGAAAILNIGTTTGNSIIELRGNGTTGTVELRTNTGVTTGNLLNTYVTTGNIFGASTGVNVGIAATSAGTLTFGGANITGNIFKINSRTDGSGTINLTSDVTTGTVNLYTGVTTGTVNLATGGASTTNIGGAAALVNIGTTTANSVLEVRGSATTGITTIRTNAGVTTANLFNTEILTANLFGVGTAINIALNATTATTLTLGSSLNSNNTFEINSTQAGAINLTSDITTGTVNLYTGVTTGTVNLATGGASTTNIGGAAALVNIGTTTGNSTLTIRGNSTSGTATVVTNAATANVFDTNSTTVNAFRAATSINIGASTGTVTISNPVITQSNATSVTFNMNGPTPTITSDQASGTANIFNTNITTLNLSNAATTLNLGNAAAAQTINIGNASTAASTYNFGTGITASATTKTINLGTSGAAGSTTNVNIGSNAGGTTTINSGTLVGSSTLQNVFATTAITVNAFLAATTIEIGADSGTLEINNPTVVGSQTTQNVFNTVATTVNAFGAAETINTGAAGNNGVYTINNDNVVLLGDLQVKGGDLTTNKTTFNLLNNTVQTLNFVGAASTINIANFNTQLNYLGTSNLGSVNIARGMVIEGNIIAKRDVEIRGSLNLTGDINGGPLRTDDIQIVGNRIETTASNSDFEINTQGVGNILLLADTKQTGTIQVNSQLTINTNSITTVSGNTDLVFTAHGTGRINLETVAISGNNIDTTDSSGISITPSVNFESDIIAENGIITRANIVPNVNMTHNLGELTKRFAKGHFGEVTLVTDLLVEYGGTGVSSFTSKGILYGNGSNPLQVTAASDPGVSNQTTSYGVLTTDVNNVPIWTDVIDGGSY